MSKAQYFIEWWPQPSVIDLPELKVGWESEAEAFMGKSPFTITLTEEQVAELHNRIKVVTK